MKIPPPPKAKYIIEYNLRQILHVSSVPMGSLQHIAFMYVMLIRYSA